MLHQELSFVDGAPLATEKDFAPFDCIAPFGDCKAPLNPDVKKASGAPQPCIPATLTPWSGVSSDIEINGLAVLTERSTCACQWGGTITPATPGQDIVSLNHSGTGHVERAVSPFADSPGGGVATSPVARACG